MLMTDAIVTAGGKLKPDSELLKLTGIEKKALIPIAGKPMIGWVIDALRDSGVVNHIAIVGLKPDDLDYDDDMLHFADSTGNLVDNVFTGLYKIQEYNPTPHKLLIMSSDIPLITAEIVKGFVDECAPHDREFYYSVVKQETMETRFPHSNRTFVPFKDGRFSGGDAFMVDAVAVKGNIKLAKELTGSRKNYFRQARMIGFGFIFKFLLRQLTVEQAGIEAGKRGNLDGKVIITKYAELGMDVDKLHQYEMVKEELEQRNAQATKVE